MIQWNVHVWSESALQVADRTADRTANRTANCTADRTADRTADCKSNMYIPVYHTNGRSIKNTIGVVMHRLVGMGLKDRDLW